MNKDALHVRSVTVEKLYGIDHRGLRCDDLSPAVNVIYGPNAQGKTSLGLAIHGLIWPATLRRLRPVVSGQFTLGEDEYAVVVDGGGAHYQRNGLDGPAPTAPDPGHRNRYWLPLHKLLQADDSDFAEIIRRAALGGIDIDQAAEDLGFQAPSTRARHATRNVEQVFARVRGLEDQHRSLQEREEGLEVLRRDLSAAVEAEQRVRLYERAIEFAAARREAEAVGKIVEEMPEAIANAREDDAAQLRQLRVEIAEARDRRSVAERRLRQFRSRHDANTVVSSGSPTSPIGKLEQQHSVLANLESRLQENRRSVAAARALEGDVWSRIDGTIDVGRAEAVNVQSIGEVDSFIDDVESHRAAEKAFEALERVLGDEKSDELQRLIRLREEAITALREWLRSDRETGRSSNRARVATAVSAILFLTAAVAGVALGMFFAGGVAAVAALVLAIIWWMMPRTREASLSEEDQFSRRGLDPPARWSAEEVARRLDELEVENSELRLRLQLAQRREALQPDLAALEPGREELWRRRSDIARRLGIEPPLRETQLRLFLDMLTSWQKARADRISAEAHLEEGTRLAEEILADINATIAPFVIDAVGTAGEAKAAIGEIDEAYRELAELQRELERETLTLEGATSAEVSAQKRIDAIFERLKLDPDVGDEVVMRLCDQLDSYRDRYQEYSLKQQRASDAERHLQAEAGFEPALLELTEEDLRDRRSAAETRAASRHPLLQQIAAVETRIDDLRRQHNLEAARADLEAALDTLERDFEQAADAAVGHMLTDHLIDRARDDQLPAVFGRARDLFSRISHGTYRLELDRRQGLFYATDNVRRRGFQLDELSSGTRIQLLLAVRIAFVEQQELGSRLPLVLDEALAISDDERAQAIVETILTLTREGRQVFYFTAQYDEVAKWKRALDGVDHRLIPLGDAIAPDAIETDALPSDDFGRHVPEPAGRDWREYGASLGVPRWNAHMEVSELHLWYLVDDPETLHRLLTHGFQYWGQIEALSRDGAIEAAGLDATTFTRFAVKAEALQAWQKCWGIGRGERISREVLAECPAVSATFLDRVVELCEEGGGDGRTLVRRLREGAVAGFRTNKMDELEEHFVDAGYIDRQERLTDEEIWSRVVAQILQRLRECDVSVDQIDRFLATVREGPPAEVTAESEAMPRPETP